ncbi:MAG: hypothetical protein M5U09_06870 [Gammaproteobacteria bacterium]|nr:hypothetical protein [Gammaproteobacteria bacterium]
MKLAKLIDTLTTLLNADRREQLRRYDEMKTVLRKLRRKRNELLDELELAEGEEREMIQRRLDIVVAERARGIAILRDLKKARDAS